VFTSNGTRLPIEVSVGDRVLYYRRQATNLLQDKEDLHIVNEPAILAILDLEDVETSREKQLRAEADVAEAITEETTEGVIQL